MSRWAICVFLLVSFLHYSHGETESIQVMLDTFLDLEMSSSPKKH